MTVRAGVVLVVGLALAGCSGGGSGRPQASNVVLPPMTASPTPSATAVALPSAATADTLEGATAFVKAYYQEIGDAFVRADTSRLEAWSAPSCAPCTAIIEGINEATLSSRYEGGGITSFTGAGIQDRPDRISVSLVYSSRPLTRIAKQTGSRDQLQGANRVALEVTVLRKPTSWQVLQILKARR